MGSGMLLGLLSGLGDILNAVFRPLFTWMINTVVVPVVQAAIRVLMTVIQYFTSAIFYEISKFLLGLIDFVEVLFRALAGLPSTASNGSEITLSIGGKSGDLLIQMLTSKEVLQVFYATAIVGVFLLIITTIFSMIKVEYTTEGAQNSKSSIIGKSLKSLCNMLIIPLLCVMGVFIGNQVLDLIDTATGGQQGTKISGTLWVTAASGAMLANEKGFVDALTNSGTIKSEDEIDSSGGLIGLGISLAVTQGFYTFIHDEPTPPLAELGDLNGKRTTIENEFSRGNKSYYEIQDVIEYYNPFEVNYLVLIFGACIIIKCLYYTCFGLVDRLYQCTALFIVMPMVVGMSPVKDSLGSWRSKFISKALSAYGTVISLNLFFIIVKIMLNIDIKFGSAYNDWIFPPTFMAGLIKAIMVIVGCLMIEKLAGDLGGYFGGGNAMADGKGLAKEATAGVTKAAMAAGMVATGGASLLAKGVKGTVGIAGKIGGGISSGISTIQKHANANAKNKALNKEMAKSGVTDSQLADYHATQNLIGENDSIIKASNADIKSADKEIKSADKIINSKTASRSEKAQAQAMKTAAETKRNNAIKKKTQAESDNIDLKDSLKNDYSGKAFELSDKADKANAKKDARDAKNKESFNKVKDSVKQTAFNARDSVATNANAVRQYWNNKFGAEAAFKTFAPKALQDERKAYQDAYKQGNSVSPEGEAMMATIEANKKKKAESAYDSNLINKIAISSRNREQLGLVMNATNVKLASATTQTNSQLDSLNKTLENLIKQYDAAGNDQTKKDFYANKISAVQQNMQSLNGKIEFGNDFRVSSDLHVDFKMDQHFMDKLKDQVKKGVKMDDIMEQVKEEFKKMGLAGNDKLLNEIYKALEELKGQVGSGK